MTLHRLPTSFADIAVRDSGGAGPAVLLIHGNSSCKEIFRRQFESEALAGLRLLALDLPGHGASGDAHDPAVGYTLGGYARMAGEVLDALGVGAVTVVGWSLGGHVALDMLSRRPPITGVMINGTPPVPGGLKGLELGFQQTPLMALGGAREWSRADAEAYARATVGEGAPFEPFMLEAARRTPGEAREIFFADALFGPVDNQRTIAQTARTPLAIVNGAADGFIKAAYFDTVAYANLWRGQVFRLEDAGHAPFWQAPDRFDPLLAAFVAETGEG